MSNPCINRWGMNTFWYRFWYSDIRYSENVKQDSLFIKLLNVYLFYGINLPINIFYNYYWYLNNIVVVKLPDYFRLFTFKNQVLGLKSSYRLRQKTNDIYPMKIWLLKFDKWLIINFYWFQPLKKKFNKNNNKFNKSRDSFNLTVSNDFHNNSFRKLKTILSLTFFKTFLNKSYYKF